MKVSIKLHRCVIVMPLYLVVEENFLGMGCRLCVGNLLAYFLELEYLASQITVNLKSCKTQSRKKIMAPLLATL